MGPGMVPGDVGVDDPPQNGLVFLELANQIDAQIWQLVHSLTLYQRPEMWVTKKNLANHGAFGFAEIVYEDIGWAKP